MRNRFGRMVPKGEAYSVHVISRVVGRQFLLGPEEKEHFLRLMRRLAAFSGIEVLTYCVMDNHVHLLCHVPRKEEVSDELLLKRLQFIYTRPELGEVEQRLERFSGYATPSAYEKERAKYVRRMYDLGVFMKALKQQFTRWYNRKHERKGTLWEARYKSVVVEGSGHPLLAMATYIDLNPVRAGLCEDPKDYHWCGYSEALAGSQPARHGLKEIVKSVGRSTDWRLAHRSYRMWLYGAGEEAGLTPGGEASRKGFNREKVAKTWKEDGSLRREELLRCRVRYFTDGLALGSKDYLDEFFEQFRDRFGENRKQAGSPIRSKALCGLCTMRDLQVDVVQ